MFCSVRGCLTNHELGRNPLFQRLLCCMRWYMSTPSFAYEAYGLRTASPATLAFGSWLASLHPTGRSYVFASFPRDLIERSLTLDCRLFNSSNFLVRQVECLHTPLGMYIPFALSNTPIPPTHITALVHEYDVPCCTHPTSSPPCAWPGQY